LTELTPVLMLTCIGALPDENNVGGRAARNDLCDAHR
jgi:hypothetical protein